MSPFAAEQRARQAAYRLSASDMSSAAGTYRDRAYDFLLPEGEPWKANLYGSIREQAIDYFNRHGVVWHRMARHLLSSQVCCINHLMPFSDQPDALRRLLQPFYPGANLRPLILPESEGGYVAFEWVGAEDHLHEGTGGTLTRGANCTSVDAAVLFEVDGRREMLLIEWKYTEAYGPRLPGGKRARRVRERRYADLAFAPHGPVRADLGLWLTDFFYEPFYQLLRQQMLAHHMQAKREHGCDRVRVLHLSPSRNSMLHKVTSPELRRFGNDALELWPGLLQQPDDFISASIETFFAPAAAMDEMSAWRAYIGERYLLASEAPQ